MSVLYSLGGTENLVAWKPYNSVWALSMIIEMIGQYSPRVDGLESKPHEKREGFQMTFPL